MTKRSTSSSIVVTGFGPFGRVRNNPSAELVAKLSNIKPNLKTAVLTSRFAEAGDEVIKLLDSSTRLLLMFGYSAKAKGFKLERYAKNSPDFYETKVDLNSLVKKLQSAELPAYISNDAGSFVCNHAYFAALNEIARKKLKTKCVFIHIPPQGKYLTQQQRLEGTLISLKRLD